MPCTTSISVSSDVPSSIVITPSLPICFMASAMVAPISASPFAEMAPIWAISTFVVTFLAFFLRSATTASTARSMPRFRSMGFIPAATALTPFRTIARASTIAVVVPSPASRELRRATSRTICTPMFSNLSSSSISRATLTPSLVIFAPNDRSMATLRPFGPSVTLTASASVSTPRSIPSRASNENLICLAVTAPLPDDSPSARATCRRCAGSACRSPSLARTCLGGP